MQEAEAAAACARKSERRSGIYRPGQPQRRLRNVSIRQNQRQYLGRFPRHRPPRQSAGHPRASHRPLSADHPLSCSRQRITGATRVSHSSQTAEGLVSGAGIPAVLRSYGAMRCASIAPYELRLTALSIL